MKVDFKSMEARLGTMIAEPTLLCWDRSNDIVAQICALPMLGMDATDANSLCYPVVLFSPRDLSSSQVSECVANALEQFDMEALHSVASNQPVGTTQFRIFVDVTPHEHKGQHIYHAIASISVGAEHIARIRTLLTKQLGAHDRITNLTAERPPTTH